MIKETKEWKWEGGFEIGNLIPSKNKGEIQVALEEKETFALPGNN